MPADDLMRLLDRSRKVTLITRYGAGKSWLTDGYFFSMQTSASGLKTRHFGTIISELTACLRVHAACKSRLGVISLEFTCGLNEEGFSVTECVGGSMELSEEQLGLRYQTSRSSFQAEGDVCTRN
ncbi:hypothetical protein B0H13DRAFT_2014523 [Mycena leptocephala]|nr:hypothetical protein B0H13DRAFT_2014523 [Mycena leptocephala]